jgi:hypothetical protein
VALTVGQIVVNGILFAGKLLEEELCEIRDPRFRIFDTLGHFTELTFHLDHPVEDQVSEYHERILFNPEVCIREALVQLTAILINDIAERNSDISESNNDVTFDICIFGSLQDLEEQTMVLIAELRTDAKDFAERQCRCGS